MNQPFEHRNEPIYGQLTQQENIAVGQALNMALTLCLKTMPDGVGFDAVTDKRGSFREMMKDATEMFVEIITNAKDAYITKRNDRLHNIAAATAPAQQQMRTL
jgi:hypothetical protein